MDGPPPMMSTPIKSRYSSLLEELARLPSILFGHYSRDLLKKDTPTNSFLPSLNGSPCRHSPRLLSNGYYTMEDNSFTSEDEGNISFSPTVCRVSYKENTVRIFKRRRRPCAQRALDLSHCDSRGQWTPAPLAADFPDCEPLDFHQTPSSHTDKSMSDFAALEGIIEGSSKHCSISQHVLIGSYTCSDDPSKFILVQKRKLHEGPSVPLRQTGTLEEVSKDQRLEPHDRPLVPLSQNGSLEEVPEDDPGAAEQRKKEQDLSIALLYICVLILIALLYARSLEEHFWE